MGDITIRGAGIFGLATAWACLSRGARVQVIDPNGVAAGASGGVVGALAPHVPEKWSVKKELQRVSLLQARDFWPMIDEMSGLDSGYARLGRLQPIENERALELAHIRAAGADQFWHNQAVWQVVDQVPDWVPPSPMGKWVWDDMTARINPARACASLAQALTLRGCPILRDGVDRGDVIWATGVADLAAISAHRDTFFGHGEKGQAAVLDIDLRNMPQLYINSIHITPHSDGTTAIGSTTERYYDDPYGTDALLDDLIERARAAVPALQSARVIKRWANERPRSKSRGPVIGPHPIHQGAYIVNGGFKIGYGMSLILADLIADLVIHGVDNIPDDFKPHNSF